MTREVASAERLFQKARKDFVTHIRTEHSTFRWLFEPMLTTAGFEILDAEFNRRTYARYVCRNRHHEG